MKSLLVDAIRAANNEDEIKPDDSASFEHAEHVEDASNDATDDVEAPIPETDGLELMQTTAGLLPAEIDEGFDELESPEDIDVEASPTALDMATVDEQPAAHLGAASSTAANSRIPRFERLGFWSPVLCLLLGLTAGAVYSVWNYMAGDSRGSELFAMSQLDYDENREASRKTNSELSRFPFLEYRTAVFDAAPPRVVVESNDRRPELPPIQIETGERTLADTTELDDHTFTSLTAAYNAYLAGDMRKTDIRRILANRVERANPQTKTDVKLLLQRHPDSALLHHALGTLLAKDSRWPEARLAFTRASELAEAGTTR